MVNEAKKGKRYRVISNNHRTFNQGDIVVALENGDVPYCVLKSEYVEGKHLGDYTIKKVHSIANYNLEEIEQEEQPSSTEKKITISKDDFRQALMLAMSNKGIDELLSKQPLLVMAFILFGSLIEVNLFKEEKEGE